MLILQHNQIILILFIFFYLFNKKFKNTKPDFIIRLMVTVYITMTMLVFWFGLFVQGDIVKNQSIYEWISTFILHTIITIAMILSYIVTEDDTFYKFETHHKANCWPICLYSFLYLICVLIIGYIRHAYYQPDNTLFPYLFLNFYVDNNVLIPRYVLHFNISLFGLTTYFIFVNKLKKIILLKLIKLKLCWTLNNIVN